MAVIYSSPHRLNAPGASHPEVDPRGSSGMPLVRIEPFHVVVALGQEPHR